MPQKDSNDREQRKTMLDVDYTPSFRVDCFNILDATSILSCPGYTNMNMDMKPRAGQKESADGPGEVLPIDSSRVDREKTMIKVILKYFEYVCVATFTYLYIEPIMRSGQTVYDVVDMVKHHLRNRLTSELRGTEQVVEMRVDYLYKIKYK